MTGVISISADTIKSQIYTVRGRQVMMDRDLAVLYGVETKVLNQAVRRNIERFPADEFMFQMTETELRNWKSHFVTSNKEVMGLRKLPLLFDEQGVAMISAVLRSQAAIRVSIQIMKAFVQMRKVLQDNAAFFQRMDNMERKQSAFQDEINQKFLQTDQKFEQVFSALESGDLKPKQGIFYDGQVFDAYVFVADVVREAKQSIVLIDNYIDDTVLRLFVKRQAGVSFSIYTQKISPQLALDLQKHNAQYDQVVVQEFKQSHDRFLILDGTVVYHIGASLKDLGKKWFAFSKIDLSATEMLNRLV